MAHQDAADKSQPKEPETREVWPLRLADIAALALPSGVTRADRKRVATFASIILRD
jgi:hypothetical protein